LQVLTFNSHQSYIHLLATALPWTLGVVTPRFPSGSIGTWNARIRPLQENIRIYPTVGDALNASTWDWVLLHNVHDLIDARDLPLPKVFLFHGTLSGRILQDKSRIDRNLYVKNLQLLLSANKARIVYISELKKYDWGIPGDVIAHGIDCSFYGGYRGDIRGVLQVSNHLKERGGMLGWNVHEEVCRGLPAIVIGENPGIRTGRTAESWDDLREQYRSYRIYLNTSVYPYEDGYNLALLEAMATGMPVAAIRNESSPVRDGMEGIVGSTTEELKRKVESLLEDPAACRHLGAGARKRVQEIFPISGFRAAWQALAGRL
jgi:glycosyltransferase involved in cell wall biosynthesis